MAERETRMVPCLESSCRKVANEMVDEATSLADKRHFGMAANYSVQGTRGDGECFVFLPSLCVKIFWEM
jgi:hypothetical protein